MHLVYSVDPVDFAGDIVPKSDTVVAVELDTTHPNVNHASASVFATHVLALTARCRTMTRRRIWMEWDIILIKRFEAFFGLFLGF